MIEHHMESLLTPWALERGVTPPIRVPFLPPGAVERGLVRLIPLYAISCDARRALFYGATPPAGGG